MLNAVIFDLDNTLCNTEDAIILGLTETFKRNLHMFSNQTVKTLLNANRQAFETIYSNPNIISIAKPVQIWFELHRILNKKPVLEEIIKLITAQRELTLSNLTLYEGAKDLIEGLRKKDIKVGILTNGAFVEQGKKLVSLGIANLIDSLVTPDMSLVHKPHHDSYTYILRELNTKAKNSIMIGNDIIDDLKGAKGAGMKTLLLTKKVYGINNNDGIVEYTADNFQETWSCILSLLNNKD